MFPVANVTPVSPRIITTLASPAAATPRMYALQVKGTFPGYCPKLNYAPFPAAATSGFTNREFVPFLA